jgi:hypothetical protein
MLAISPDPLRPLASFYPGPAASRACHRKVFSLEAEEASWRDEAFALLREEIMAELHDLAAEDELDEPEGGLDEPEV